MIKLGDEVRDTVTGLTGIAVARHQYLQGCDRITIQPPLDNDGKIQDSYTFDEPQCEVVFPAKVTRKAADKDPGGPEKYSDVRRF